MKNIYELRNDFLDYIMDFKLFELATKRKDMINDIRNHQKSLNFHLMSIYLMNYQKNWIDHWKKEIQNWLLGLYLDSNNLKKGMLITNHDWFNYLYEEPFSNNEEYRIKGLILQNKIKFEENKIFKPKEILEKDFLNISNRFKEFWWKVSINISSKNFDMNYIMRLIDDIFIKEKEIDFNLINKIK